MNEDSGADVNRLADYGLRVAAILDPSSNEVGKSTVHRQMVDNDVVFWELDRRGRATGLHGLSHNPGVSMVLRTRSRNAASG